MNTKLHWNPGIVGVILLAAGILFVAILYEIGGQRRPQPEAAAVELTGSDPALEAKVLAIAAKFVCSCGTCGEEPLESCRCNTAIQERQFIRTSLQAGKSLQEIIIAVNNAFGWMKSEFAAKYDSTDRNQTFSSRLKVPIKKEVALPFAQALTAGSNLATAGDRVRIFSHFTCPCGQCGIDELKDCGCNHPQGATEVKGFVDQKIAEGKYTIAQVVDQVESKYGGRKF